MDRTIPLQKYDYYKGPQKLGELWTLARGTLTMRCTLATHAHGWELRLGAGNFSRVEVCRTESDVFGLADGWKAEAQAKGWA